jgi:hypothetical protein
MLSVLSPLAAASRALHVTVMLRRQGANNAVDCRGRTDAAASFGEGLPKLLAALGVE